MSISPQVVAFLLISPGPEQLVRQRKGAAMPSRSALVAWCAVPFSNRAASSDVLAVLAVLCVLFSACSRDTNDCSDCSDASPDGGTISDGGTEMTPADYDNPTPVEWVEIDGGTFLQGNTSTQSTYYEETPAHDVTVTSFRMMRTEVTCSQYAQCVLDGACAEPLVAIPDSPSGSNCNWLVWGRGDHPVNCVYVWDAEAYCAWLGARLPSESEWEYAARSRGKDNEYPWGSATPSCDYAVMYSSDGVEGCGTGHTWPVCSKPLGNTEQGLCDMAGNVKEWLPDCFYASYDGAPTDGSAWIFGECEDQVLRGGCYKSLTNTTRTRARGYNPSYGRSDMYGFRCAKDVE
jgi:formylglycine-generating enzyme required for sulfatase activity